MSTSSIFGALLLVVVGAFVGMMFMPQPQLNLERALVQSYKPSSETEHMLATKVAQCVAQGEKPQAILPLREKKEADCVEKVLLDAKFPKEWVVAARTMRLNVRPSQPIPLAE